MSKGYTREDDEAEERVRKALQEKEAAKDTPAARPDWDKPLPKGAPGRRFFLPEEDPPQSGAGAARSAAAPARNAEEE